MNNEIATAPPLRKSDEPQFRNGRPVRMAGWMFIKREKWSLSKARYIRLDGEVLSIHTLKNSKAEEAFDIVGADIHHSRNRGRRSLRIITTRRTLTCYHACQEEMQSWANSLEFASNHYFDKYYNPGLMIAEGTSSCVCYASDHDDPKSQYVVKIVNKEADHERAQEWLQRERHINSMLNHPTIVKAVDMFSTLEKDYLIFEPMRGGTLAGMLKERRKLPESYARAVMREVFKALAYIHGKNIVHRDIRPDNVFLAASKFPMAVCLGDFGHANFASDKRVDTDVLTTKVGTLPYVSADILRRMKYGPSVDMWSAGVMMYEVLCGELPFVGSTDHEVVEHIRQGKFTVGTPGWDGISAESKSLIRQLLQNDSFKRISAVGALQHEWFAVRNRSKRAVILPNGINQPSFSSTVYMSRVSGASETSSSQLQSGVPPSIRAMSEKGMERVCSDSPARMRKLMRSTVFQRQLSKAFPYRRKLVVVGRMMVFVFRLQSLTGGHCATRHMALFGRNGIGRVNELIQRNTEARESQRDFRKLAAEALKIADEAWRLAALANALADEAKRRIMRVRFAAPEWHY